MELFSTIDLVNQCLIDKKRVSAFAKALQGYIKPGDTVLDLGTGSGILSLLAAKFGAKKVTSIEIDPYLASLSKRIFKQNNFANTITVINGDARKIKFDPNQKINIVVAEMISTGMIDEYQVPAINNLLKQEVITKGTTIIPKQLDTFVSLVEADFNAYGFKIPIVKHLWKQYNNNPKFIFLSNQEPLNSYDFKEPIDENFHVKLTIKVSRSGTLNGIYLKSVAWFNEKIKLEDTTAFIAPVIIPIKSSRVYKEETVAVKISYKFGGGYKTLKVTRT